MGYPVTIFEAAPVAGGMLRLGVPEYRLPRALIQLEINAILSLGVELQRPTRASGTGLHPRRPEGPRVRGDLPRRRAPCRAATWPSRASSSTASCDGIDYLLNLNLGYKVEMGRRVVVIGGGNVALDVARTAARGGEQEQPAAQPLDRAGPRRGPQRGPVRRAAR